MTKFRDLHLGDVFDFVGPDRMLNSFFDRCVKTGPRKYRSIETDQLYTIGTVQCQVYNVNWPDHSPCTDRS